MTGQYLLSACFNRERAKRQKERVFGEKLVFRLSSITAQYEFQRRSLLFNRYSQEERESQGKKKQEASLLCLLIDGMATLLSAIS